MADEDTEQDQTKTKTKCNPESLYCSAVWLSDPQAVDAPFIFISKCFGHALAAAIVRSEMWILQ